MKSLILTISLLIGTAAQASPILIGKMDSQYETFMNAPEALSCRLIDKDKNGVMDTAIVVLRSGRFALNGGPGFMSPAYVRNEIPDSTGETCKKVQSIVELSHSSYSAFTVIVDSQLSIQGDDLVENMSLKITSKFVFQQEEKAPEVTLMTTVSKKAFQSEL